MKYMWDIVTPAGFDLKGTREFKPTLKDLQNAVEGLIQSVPINSVYRSILEDKYKLKFVNAYVNEEGLILGLERNIYASAFVDTFIAGNLVLIFNETGVEEQ